MANKFYGAISHIGGADGDLDAITEAVLVDGDGAFVIDATNNTVDMYTLNSSSATAEDPTGFTCIVPDDEAASPGKRWIKVELSVDAISTLTTIAAALKTGADAKLVTGTAGANDKLAMWNGDGDLVDATIEVSNTPQIDVAAEWTAQQNFNEDSVTSAANAVAWDWDTDQVTLHTLTENTTISAPSNANVGSIAYLRVVQAAGLFTLAWNAAFDWGTEATPSEPAADGDIVLFGFYYDGTNYLGAEIVRKEA